MSCNMYSAKNVRCVYKQHTSSTKILPRTNGTKKLGQKIVLKKIILIQWGAYIWVHFVKIRANESRVKVLPWPIQSLHLTSAKNGAYTSKTISQFQETFVSKNVGKKSLKSRTEGLL